MLFFMPAKEVQVFCMREMRIPLDLIWISDGRVAGITRNVPATFPGGTALAGPGDPSPGSVWRVCRPGTASRRETRSAGSEGPG